MYSCVEHFGPWWCSTWRALGVSVVSLSPPCRRWSIARWTLSSKNSCLVSRPSRRLSSPLLLSSLLPHPPPFLKQPLLLKKQDSASEGEVFSDLWTETGKSRKKRLGLKSLTHCFDDEQNSEKARIYFYDTCILWASLCATRSHAVLCVRVSAFVLQMFLFCLIFGWTFRDVLSPHTDSNKLTSKSLKDTSSQGFSGVRDRLTQVWLWKNR